MAGVAASTAAGAGRTSVVVGFDPANPVTTALWQSNRGRVLH